MQAQITISLQDWESARKKNESLETENQRLRAELEDARLGSGEDDRRRLLEALQKALSVTTFAIANLHPLTVRGWPYEALRQLGDLLADCPGVGRDFQECARGDWRLFAAEAERWEQARAEGREQEMLAEENAARAVGPDHPVLRGFASGASDT